LYNETTAGGAHGAPEQLQRKLQARGGGQSRSQRQRQPDGTRAGHQLHAWIRQYGEPLDVDNASVKELSARVRQLERQLALREGQIEVLKKAIGIVSEAEKNGTR